MFICFMFYIDAYFYVCIGGGPWRTLQFLIAQTPWAPYFSFLDTSSWQTNTL
jgi:UDP-galactopyranose mutase